MREMTSKKRLFDIVVALLSAVLWVPAIAVCGFAILVLDGRPVFYRSRRRVFGSVTMSILKLRVMRRDAVRIVNRESVPVVETRFLNISPDSPLYTRAGRVIERLTLTELPQLIHVLRGDMSIVGNRPLPEDVIRCLGEVFPFVEDRFEIPCGLTGPVQLVGRALISDADRLRIEIEYCRLCRTAYSPLLDAVMLLATVLIAVGAMKPLTVDGVVGLMHRFAGLPSEPFASTEWRGRRA